MWVGGSRGGEGDAVGCGVGREWVGAERRAEGR